MAVLVLFQIQRVHEMAALAVPVVAVILMELLALGMPHRLVRRKETMAVLEVSQRLTTAQAAVVALER